MTIQDYNEVVDLYADNLYRFFLKNIADSSVAQDLVQETYTKVWVKVRDIEKTKAKSYLFTVGYHCMIDFIRSKKKHEEFVAQSNTSEGVFEENDLKEVLDLALSKLPEDQRTVILLRDYEGYSYEEIEDITGLNTSQVKVYIFRARKTMKQILMQHKNIFPIYK